MTLRNEVAAVFLGALMMRGLRGSVANLAFIQPGVDTLAQQVLLLYARLLAWPLLTQNANWVYFLSTAKKICPDTGWGQQLLIGSAEFAEFRAV